MKTTFLLILGLMVSISGFAQKNSNFTFVPKGSFRVQKAEAPITISVDNFWMSNEITNKEFREFYNQIKSSPNDSITWIELSDMKNGKMVKPKIVSKTYSVIVDRLMNEFAWKSVMAKGDYFTNPKYDHYPVVGVTWEGANYYCMWRTKVETKKRKGDALQMDYRLPTQYEWEYATTFIDSKSNVDAKELHPIAKGDKNKLGLLNLNGNVSEWTSTSDFNGNLEYKVVKGSSWKSESKENPRLFFLANKGTDSIGFRIVRSDSAKE